MGKLTVKIAVTTFKSSTITKLALGSLFTFCAISAFGQSSPKHHAMHGTHRISAGEATKVALHKYPGTVVGKVALENEDGKMQYSVNVKSGKVLREIMVGADNGKIASVERTSAKDEAKESAAEKKATKHGK